ncbi:MAG: zf-HC2 domain-containing protein [Acidobacteria bacterium]|nr:zf-HC2 domain-containing protein [Acidobacteriota bacterium]
MADCRETLRELDRYLDDEVATEALAPVVAHLDGCTDCQQAFEFHAELKRVIRSSARGDELPDGLVQRLEACFGADDATTDGGTDGPVAG